MTIDSMIDLIKTSRLNNTMLHSEVEKKIIAALRAAQQMYKDLDDQEAGYTAGQAAFDAATGEDK